jgi:pimeloyl-ACP methyl ester carboxylesterase
MRADPARGGVLGEEQAQRAVALLPNGAYRYFPGAGHAIHGTKPAEFVQAVLSFASGGLS